ncbi:DNA mismatch repair endonuclease MutL [Candidatus Woesearchaeota archaeon]|nr:DNA mismatch repair endonuclease MutL [Candidatus Woesearchaeota archaeon]MBT5396647.1 DNA mismatch repair endonuclease MutL [Candidatus Woesearchaeota archaeon]MBT6367566.1 DNA mismatch repair endonuclease MutL [Candidatus Woesearchaeota archaeon]MBT7763065.1 DNA mismatch repair endonuclease MutL [Candidatus Woesearchaeota archaeon]
MKEITVLDEDLINKIAAGEVIERPASVVKELIENSLDAGATRISIDIEDSGQKRIRISDNGHGMDEENARKCILPHATSKIRSVDDLFSIKTLGFRGEALASIAAVSQVSIITKQDNQLEGFNLVVESGSVISSGSVASEKGTTIDIQNLFFNTPARKKFLKTDAVELRHIIDVVTQYALLHPSVLFILHHEGRELLTSPQVDDMKNNIASLYGSTIAKDLIEVKYENELVTIYGFIGKPHQSRNDKNQQALFVNDRWIRNNDITKAVYDGYHSLLFHHKHPVFVLHITVDPHKIDVNIHPQKKEVKIEHIKEVCAAISHAVHETLKEHNLVPVLDVEFEQQKTFGAPKPVEPQKKEYMFEQSEQTIFPEKEQEQDGAHTTIVEEYTTPESDVFISEHKKEFVIPETAKLPEMKLLGQIHKTFFVAETPGGLLLIDQHVVQERVLYERFMNQFMNKNVAVQELLRGELLEFTAAEGVIVHDNSSLLHNFGFTLEEFEGTSYLLKTVPTIFGRQQSTDLVYEVLHFLSEGRNKVEEIQEDIITRMACRASVKAGDVLSIPEMQKLLAELEGCVLPYTCPHGRSIFIKVPVDELEKKFRRK